jgi:hypothetical protein
MADEVTIPIGKKGIKLPKWALYVGAGAVAIAGFLYLRSQGGSTSTSADQTPTATGATGGGLGSPANSINNPQGLNPVTSPTPSPPAKVVVVQQPAGPAGPAGPAIVSPADFGWTSFTKWNAAGGILYGGDNPKIDEPFALGVPSSVSEQPKGATSSATYNAAGGIAMSPVTEATNWRTQ